MQFFLLTFIPTEFVSDLLFLVDLVTAFVVPLFDLDWDSFTHFGEEETGLLAASGGKASLCYYKKNNKILVI